MLREMGLTLADMHQRDLLEEHRRDRLARLTAPTREPVRRVLAHWLHTVAERLEGQTVALNIEHA